MIPAHCASRAAEWATPVLFCNTAAPERWCDSACWDARGVAIAERGEGLLVARVVPREAFDPWYAQIRAQHLARPG